MSKVIDFFGLFLVLLFKFVLGLSFFAILAGTCIFLFAITTAPIWLSVFYENNWFLIGLVVTIPFLMMLVGSLYGEYLNKQK